MSRSESSAFRSLRLKGLADRLADGPHGPLYWRRRASSLVRAVWRLRYGRA